MGSRNLPVSFPHRSRKNDQGTSQSPYIPIYSYVIKLQTPISVITLARLRETLSLNYHKGTQHKNGWANDNDTKWMIIMLSLYFPPLVYPTPRWFSQGWWTHVDLARLPVYSYVHCHNFMRGLVDTMDIKAILTRPCYFLSVTIFPLSGFPSRRSPMSCWPSKIWSPSPDLIISLMSLLHWKLPWGSFLLPSKFYVWFPISNRAFGHIGNVYWNHHYSTLDTGSNHRAMIDWVENLYGCWIICRSISFDIIPPTARSPMIIALWLFRLETCKGAKMSIFQIPQT